MNTTPYQICKKCVMDTSDPSLKFNAKGICDYCDNFDLNIKPNWHPDQSGIDQILPLVNKIKKAGANKDYDCLIGLSGGLDSSYTALVAKEYFGLRPLIFHCDTGWNSDVSVSNIEKIIDGLGLDLVTEVVEWEEMQDLQRAFFKSQVPFVDQPQDLVLFSALYNFAAKNNFKYVITGGNNSTECYRECIDWTYFATDMKFVKSIHSQFGAKQLKTLPMCDIFKYKLYYRFVKGIRVIKLLDYFPFFRQKAIDELKEKFNWTEYPMKHYESRFTRFFEGFWTPRKHNYDKRRAYFSSQIATNQMNRVDALERLKKPELSEDILNNEFRYVANKLNWTEDEFTKIFDGQNKSFRDYPNNFFLISLGIKIMNFIGIDRRRFK
ncbi:N-acetyl sugar amidotransferase [Gammaproteobacteria bacterium]|nr:N-acetyl sugar amidotransferase [Gammaproteobacteria bacterium]